jgi:hypothetical protein
MANRDRAEAAAPLWLGSGFHYAMEDYHGYNYYGDPVTAFKAYCIAQRQTPRARIPEEYSELVELGIGMLDYYHTRWLVRRDPLETYWFNGVPQVEVNIEIPLPFKPPKGSPFDSVVYDATIDRVVIDEHGRLWLIDFKTAKQFETGHLEADPQIGSYTWAASCVYDRPIAGFIYQQHKKVVPKGPRILSSGDISTAQQQATSHALYKEALTELYGHADKASDKHLNMLYHLAMQEDDHYDPFIRRDFTERNEHQLQAEGEKILLELEDMLDPNLPLYPNPTRSCGYMCPFFGPCIAFDDGGDWEQLLEETTIDKGLREESEHWRRHLPVLEEM